MGNDITPATIVLVALLLISGSQFTLFAMWFDMELYVLQERPFNRMVDTKRDYRSAMIFANSGNERAPSNPFFGSRSRLLTHSRGVPRVMARAL
jgi:hypothetical protein